MNIMGFSASPRKRGNTAWLVDQILQGAKERGALTQAWHFSDLEIKPCQGCLGCKQGQPRCIIQDGMQKIYDAPRPAEVLILGSPVYMGQMSAQAKIFTDRLFAQHSPRFSPHFTAPKNGKKKLVLVFSQGNPDASLFAPYFDYTKKMFQLLEFEVKGVHVVAGMRNEPASERKNLQPAMKDIGALLVSGPDLAE